MTSSSGEQGRLFVTGGAGFLGRHLVARARRRGWAVTAPSSRDCDVRDRDAIVGAVSSARPHVVAHLAYRRDEPDTLIVGSRHVAEAAAGVGARLVHLSTDVVFGGRDDPYDETVEPDPMIDYGRWKLDGERAVMAADAGAVLVRTSLMFGDAEDLSPGQRDVVDAVAGRRSMTFFTDEVRCPAHVDDIADAVLALGSRPDVAGPLHVAGPLAISRAELAMLIARALDLDPSALVTSTIAESGQRRPARVVLASARARALGIEVRDPHAALGIAIRDAPTARGDVRRRSS